MIFAVDLLKKRIFQGVPFRLKRFYSGRIVKQDRAVKFFMTPPQGLRIEGAFRNRAEVGQDLAFQPDRFEDSGAGR